MGHVRGFHELVPLREQVLSVSVGHPKVITKDFGGIEDYFGIAKVKILPPRGLYHPVLPYRSNGKLQFPQCKTCADTEDQSPCTCSKEVKELTGTWCTPKFKWSSH